jgi:hypothetical protein
MHTANTLFSILALSAALSHSQITPEISAWILNTTGAKGYGGILSNVQKVQYSATNVYISSASIPDYGIGPWPSNPNKPSDQAFVFKITRAPARNTGTAVQVGMGHIGVWTNGVSVFNSKDGRSYQNQQVWNQNAIVVEGPSFDSCLGHPAPNGEYHHHLHPKCLYDETDGSRHSPIIGYAFDGFPIYGGWAYSGTDGKGAIRLMRSSYRMRTLTERTTLPGGAAATYPGPAVGTTYPLGYYLEDFEFVENSGDLDVRNGRFCLTPEYPEGTYAYFATIDSTYKATFPYTLGPTYYGTVQAGNTGPTGGRNTITESVQTYATSGFLDPLPESGPGIRAERVGGRMLISVEDGLQSSFAAFVVDVSGKVVLARKVETASTMSMDLHQLAAGIFWLKVAIPQGAGLTRRFHIHP